jgi:hypothetical protein
MEAILKQLGTVHTLNEGYTDRGITTLETTLEQLNNEV